MHSFKKCFAVLLFAAGFASVSKAEVIAYWPFGEYGFRDASGNNHTLTADVAHVKAKLSTGYADMDGSQSFFQTVTNLEMTGSLTIEFFTKFDQALNQSRNGQDCVMLIELGAAVWGVQGCGFCIDFNEDGYRGNHHAAHTDYAWGHGFAGCMLAQYKHEPYNPTELSKNNMCEARTFFGPETDNISGDQYFADGEWHHIAVFFDDSKGDFTGIRMLIDHEHEFFAGDGYLRTPYHPEDGPMDWDKNSKFNIGNRQGGTLRFTGLMDDIRITSGILSDDRLLSVRTPGKDALSIRLR